MIAHASKDVSPATAAVAFMPLARTGSPMFEVREGLPLGDVLNQASIFLSSIAALSHQSAENIEHGTPDATLLYAQADLIEMADACVMAVLSALSHDSEFAGRKGGAA